MSLKISGVFQVTDARHKNKHEADDAVIFLGGISVSMVSQHGQGNRYFVATAGLTCCNL